MEFCHACRREFPNHTEMVASPYCLGESICLECFEALNQKPMPMLEEVRKDFVKHDQEKIRLELIPPSFLTSTGAVLTYGAIKYDDHNWAKCPKWSRYYGALLRHLIAILMGQENDSESGLPHQWHLNCNAAFLTEFQEAGIGENDLPKRTYKNRDEAIAEAFVLARKLHDESA